MKKKDLIVVRGAGDLATGTIHRLKKAGFRLLVLEAEHPAAIRRQVALSEAVYAGSARVEDVEAVRMDVDLAEKKNRKELLEQEMERIWKKDGVPVLVDPAGLSIAALRPAVVVDAILAKKNLGTTKEMAPLVIALGPGFTAGEDVDVVIETKRGHNLGRVIRSGSAVPNTGIPGIIGGYGKERVMHAQAEGILRNAASIGDIVEARAVIAEIETENGTVPVEASLSGLLRGLIRDGYPVTKGFKIADIDPRKEELQNCFTISDKARCIAGSVLEVICGGTGIDSNRKSEAFQMKLMKTEDAVGQVLCHDITQIIKGVTKDAVFRKGHIITEEDIPVLLSVGKDNIYIWEKDDTMLHENEAAQILYDICKNDHMHPSDVKEGKIELIADCDGLLKVDREKLKKVNSLGEMMIATRHGDTYVKKGDKLAGTRIIPLVIKKEKMETAQAVCSDGPILTLKPFHKKKFAVLTTGNEVYYHRIEDTFTPVIQEKLAEFGAEMIFHEVYDDDASKITDGCRRAMEAGADLVFCTGGMSVDPDDKTPLAIKNTGARIVSYGAPVLPGAMFLLAYAENGTPIVGLPGCVMYSKRTIFDLVLPRLIADDEVTAEELAGLGEGGLCLNCKVCTFPNCGFGKGR